MANNTQDKSVSNIFRNTNLCSGLLAIFLFSPSLEVLAQSGVLEEVTVTAQKREQSLQDVGIAISAFSGEQMKTLGMEKSFDIAAFTPGVHISGNLAGQNTQFSIRGVTQNDFNDIIEAPVAVYLDDGYLAVAQAQTFALFDIERVEILKGPQGTLFGRNATGGLVHYISRKPTFDKTEGYVDVTYGIFDSPADADQYTVEAAVGGPLSDTLAGRVAIKYNQHDGYLQNNFTDSNGFGAATVGIPGATSNAPGAGAGADLGDDDTFAGRVTLLFEPNEDLSISLSANGATTEVSTGPYQSKATIGVFDGVGGIGELINVIDVAPGETRTGIAADGSDFGGDTNNNGFFGIQEPNAPGAFPGVNDFIGRAGVGTDFFGYVDPDGSDFTTSSDFAFKDQGSVDTWGINAHIEWNLSDSITVTSVTDYKDYEKLLFIDVDSAPVNQLANYAAVDATSFTQELRLNGETDRTRWVAGFYYLNIDSQSDNGLKGPVNSLPVAFDPIFSTIPAFASGVDIGVQADLQTDSFSLFGQVEWDLTEQLTLITGLRVIQEEKDYFMRQGFFVSTSPHTVNVGTPIINIRNAFFGVPDFTAETSDTLWTGKIQLDWHATDDLLLYGGVNRGVKAGSFNAPIPGGLGFPDSILSYDEEVLLSFEGGFKASLFNGTTRVNGSVFYYDYSDYQAFLFTGVAGVVVNADAENIGVELEIRNSPMQGLDLMVNFSWFDATVKDVPLRVNSPLAARDVDPTYAPEFQTAGLVRYEWPMFNGMMSAQTNISYSDSFFYNLRNFDADKFDSYVKVDLRLGWTSQNGNWQGNFIVNNVTDEAIGIQGFDLATLCGCNEVSYQPPRWFGFNVKYSF